MYRGMRGVSSKHYCCCITGVFSRARNSRVILHFRASDKCRKHVAPPFDGAPLESRKPPGFRLGVTFRKACMEIRANIRGLAEIWLRASQFCGARCRPVSFAVAPPGPGTIYRGPGLNVPRTKHHYAFEKMHREGWS